MAVIDRAQPESCIALDRFVHVPRLNTAGIWCTASFDRQGRDPSRLRRLDPRCDRLSLQPLSGRAGLYPRARLMNFAALSTDSLLVLQAYVERLIVRQRLRIALGRCKPAAAFTLAAPAALSL